MIACGSSAFLFRDNQTSDMPRRPRRRAGRAAAVRAGGRAMVAAILLCALSGCTTVKLAVGSQPADVESVRTGMARTDIDALLGPPIFAKGSRQTFYQATYAVDQGYQPGGGMVALGALMDIMTLGTSALYVKSDQPVWERPRVVIVYDKDNKAVGLFDAGDIIPADGRSHGRPTGLTRKAENGKVGP